MKRARGSSRWRVGFFAAVCGGVGLGFFPYAPGAAAAAAADRLWASHIEPLLKERCLECHNPTKAKSGLDLSSLQTILRGGERGASVIPGRPEESNLFKFLDAEADPHMPPGKRKPLGEEEAGLVKQWIRDLPLAGAPINPEGPSSLAGSGPMSPAKPRLAWQPPARLSSSEVVDHFLELAWKLDRIKPAARAGDAVFVRRVYLDLVGRIPTSVETDTFLAERSRDKRPRLIDRLLESAEYPRHFREVFDPVLMTRRGAEWENQRAKHNWFAYLEEAFARNRAWNEVVRDLIVARPGPSEERGAVWFLYERQNNPQAMAEALAPLVFGVQVKCAQCHDHMVAREIKQAHYWALVAALNRSKNVDTPAGPGLSESAIGGFVSFANLKKESQPALLTFFNGRKVDEPWPKEGVKETDAADLYVVPPPPGKEKSQQPAVPRFSRRAALADAVTRDNPLLARATVNRIWALLFGRGLVHPVELMDSKHPPSHPELLSWLTSDFERSGYDVKRLVRALVNTRAYQRESRLEPAGKAKLAPPDSFARVLDKPLSAEQLFRSLLVATRNAVDAQGKVAGLSENELRRALVAQFPDLFPTEYNASLQQALFLSNSRLVAPLIQPQADNLAAQLLATSGDAERVRRAFAAVLGRGPDREEQRACVAYLAARSREAGVSQLLWALLTGAEFQLNH